MVERRLSVSYGRTWGLPNYSSERFDISFEADIGPSADKDKVSEDLFEWARKMVHDAHDRKIPEAEFKQAGGTTERKGEPTQTSAQDVPATNGNGDLLSPAQAKYLYNLTSRSEKNQTYVDQVLAKLGVKTIDGLKKADASRLIEAMVAGGQA